MNLEDMNEESMANMEQLGIMSVTEDLDNRLRHLFFDYERRMRPAIFDILEIQKKFDID